MTETATDEDSAPPPEPSAAGAAATEFRQTFMRRDEVAVTRDQLGKLRRFMEVGKATLSGSMWADVDGNSAPGANAVMFAFAGDGVVFTMPYKQPRGSTSPANAERFTAVGVAVSNEGVALLAYFTPIVGDDRTAAITSRPRAKRWLRIDDVTAVETPV